jgi:rifampicin phosphotransferase
MMEVKTGEMYAEITGKQDWDYNYFDYINGYAYYNMSYPPALMLRMLLGGLTHTHQMLTTGERKWREGSHPQYCRVIERWQSRAAADWSAAELLEGAREISAAAAFTYTILQSGIIPTATFDEFKFTQFYNRLIKKEQDPPAATFLLGFESAPIHAEKALYDLAMWARSLPALAGYLTASTGSQIAAQVASGTAPEGVPDSEWRAWSDRLSAHLDQHGSAIYDLDFAKPTPAETPGPILDTMRMYLRGEGRSPYERLAEMARTREQAAEAVLKRVNGWKRKWFIRLLKNAQTNGPLREDGLADLGLGYPLLRRLLLELGARLARGGMLAQAGDIFWLTETEAAQAAAALGCRAHAWKPKPPRSSSAKRSGAPKSA